MNYFLKLTLTNFIFIVLISIGLGIFKMATTGWFEHASFITIGLLALGLSMVGYGAYHAIKEIWKKRTLKTDYSHSATTSAKLIALLITTVLVYSSCARGKSNQQVVVSNDCGVNWEMIKTGESIPLGTGNRCFMKVIMPNFPMQGDALFVANFAGKVRAKIHIDFDYSIVDGLCYIKQAKFLGKSNVDTDDIDLKAFETAENSVIDKRIREVVKELLQHEDIVDTDQGRLEDIIFDKANEMLAPLGVKLNFITLTFDLDTQTRQAIDVATAMKIYRSKSLEAIGEKVIAARAGASTVNVTTTAAPESKKEEQ